ncbi:MAG TPA: macrolide ABC transporter ATP-binding protein [Lachnospiraceae bacterium]|nr:macrolide ABC transporter ATP-binding protein [Lachnospiraceae bacterium]
MRLPEEIIKLKNIRKIYRMGDEKIAAVNNISLNFNKGEICCLLGTSGSGKSTLLNLISGLEKPTKGEIIIHNKHIERMNEDQLAKFRQKYIGFIFQSYNLLGTLTALENVTLPLIFNKVPSKERKERALEMLKAVGLEDRANHKPSELSGGQQQRVSIARAFVNNPQVVFADEPTGNLDTKTTYLMMDLMIRLAEKNKQTMIIVTHDLEISAYADRVIYLTDGRVENIKENKNKITSSAELVKDGGVTNEKEA